MVYFLKVVDCVKEYQFWEMINEKCSICRVLDLFCETQAEKTALINKIRW